MDFKKMFVSKQVSYRLAARDKRHLDKLMDVMMDAKDANPSADLTTLDFLGMLWMGIKAENPVAHPSTRQERQYMVTCADLLNRNFNGRKYGNKKDPNHLLHVDMIERCKKLLIELHFSALSKEQLEHINNHPKLQPETKDSTDRAFPVERKARPGEGVPHFDENDF